MVQRDGGVVGVVGVDWTIGLGAGGAEEMRMVAVEAGKEGRRCGGRDHEMVRRCARIAG